MFKNKNKTLLNWQIFILTLIILTNKLKLTHSMPTPEDKTSSDSVIPFDMNNPETLRSLEELIEVVRKIRQNENNNNENLTLADDTTIDNDITTITPSEEPEIITTTASTTTTTTTSTTTESSNFSDLESSFGGLGNVREVKQPQKLNGFYFLADINSFLEVGDGDEKVVVRYNPKIGNPSNFIPIPGTRT